MAWKLAGAGRPTTTAPPNRRAAAPTGRWNTPPHTPDSKSSCAHPAAPQPDAPVVIVSWSVPTATTAPAVTGAASTQPTVTRSLGRTSPNACCWARRVSNGPRTNPNASPRPSTSPSPKPGTKPPPPHNNAATNEPDTPHPTTPQPNNRPILHAKRPCGTERPAHHTSGKHLCTTHLRHPRHPPSVSKYQRPIDAHQRDSGLMPGVRVDVTGGYLRVPHAVRGTDGEDSHEHCGGRTSGKDRAARGWADRRHVCRPFRIRDRPLGILAVRGARRRGADPGSHFTRLFRAVRGGPKCVGSRHLWPCRSLPGQCGGVSRLVGRSPRRLCDLHDRCHARLSGGPHRSGRVGRCSRSGGTQPVGHGVAGAGHHGARYRDRAGRQSHRDAVVAGGPRRRLVPRRPAFAHCALRRRASPQRTGVRRARGWPGLHRLH